MTPTPNTGLKEAVERVTKLAAEAENLKQSMSEAWIGSYGPGGKIVLAQDLRLILSALPPVVEAPGDQEGELSPENRAELLEDLCGPA